ncbi:hypothetical protein CTAYLR_008727 [Chrysophaeum taylorii]|uniref:DNA2/NAM7 helicase-like C-terminal domain-containing protein n=1 Tax=Chrysophaeum taylorii TaxID=2483200 RepID=A0AAD7UM36_9STRA|nr:hypothetical protein CTAYLR_008727 [Chrysophaeum taylorii]
MMACRKRPHSEAYEEAGERLVGMLQYVKDLQRLALKDKTARTVLEEVRAGTKRSVLREAEALVLGEGSFRKLEAGRRSHLEAPLCEIRTSLRDEPAFLVVRRPRDDEAHGDEVSELAKSTYAELFALRQERIDVVCGVGLVRWGDAVSHPAVEVRCSVDLRPGDGSLVVSAAETATLWTFPGVEGAAPALQEIAEAAEAYGLDRKAPTDRDAWAPLLRRVAHTLSARGQYVEGPPTSKKSTPHPVVYNCFVLYCRDSCSLDEAGSVSKDAEDVAADLARRRLPGELPVALRRLAGVQPDHLAGVRKKLRMSDGDVPSNMAPPASSSSSSSFLDRFVMSWFRAERKGTTTTTTRFSNNNNNKASAETYYFGLACNEQQVQVAATLQEKGCCVLFGPPGTGKSQTIANVICHYVATGRRVLVSSKQSSATEVLRGKLPEGIRDLCVSLGDADAASFRRLEAAVERLADTVAAAHPSTLRARASTAGARLRRLDADLEKLRADERRDAAQRFFDKPHTLHDEHVVLLLADDDDARRDCCDEEEDGDDDLFEKRATSAVALATAAHETLRPFGGKKRLSEWRPSFLADVEIHPERPPPAQSTIDELRLLRRQCADVLQLGAAYERQLVHLARTASLFDSLDAQRLRQAAAKLDEKRELDRKVRLALLPRVLEPTAGRALLRYLEALAPRVAALERAPPPWLLLAVRRAYDARVLERAERALYFADKILELAPRGLESVVVPDVLLGVVTRANQAHALNDDEDDDDAHLLGIDFADEIHLRAEGRPRRRGLWSWLFSPRRPSPGRSALQANLAEIRVNDARPATPAEWRCVERRLVLRGCAVRLVAHVAALGRVVNVQVDHRAATDDAAAFDKARQLAAPLRTLVDALKAAAPVHDLAHRAVSAASPLEAAARGEASLRDDLDRLRDALKVYDDDSLAKAERLRDALVAELRSLDQSSVSRDSPLADLRAATHALLCLDDDDEIAEDVESRLCRWLRARARIHKNRAALSTLAELRQRCRASDLGRLAPTWGRLASTAPVVSDDDEVLPRHARKLWAAAATAVALDSGGGKAEDADARRSVFADLLSRRDAAVQAYVSAVAKVSLREKMSPSTCAALVRLVSAVSAASSVSADSARAPRLREDLANAMADCASAVPVWIMPCARVAQCLPAQVGAFDLVVLDEASQSDACALPVLARGREVLVVGDHKQVSPTASFVAEKDIFDLRARLRHPYKEQLLPGRSIFDLAHVCFADARVSLTQHFRCVPPCIAFSNDQFYNGHLEPRRLPPSHDAALFPPLLDVRVSDGRKRGKLNEPEARAIATYLRDELGDSGDLAAKNATVAVISLLGMEQARLVRKLSLDLLADDQLARHRVVFGDPASLQGDERDVVLLSMVASPKEAPAQTGRLYEQRYNVAMSRARHRVVLFRSLDPSHVSNPDDLKYRLMSFFMGYRLSRTTPPRHHGRHHHHHHHHHRHNRGIEAEVLGCLEDRGFVFELPAAPVAGSLCVVHGQHDAKVCVCIDGGPQQSTDDYADHLRDQRNLERSGWRFFRLWQASWLVDRPTSENRLLSACRAVGADARDAGGRAPHRDDDDDDDDGHALVVAGGSGTAAGPVPAPRRRKAPPATSPPPRRADHDDEEVEEEVEVVMPARKKQHAASKRRRRVVDDDDDEDYAL